MKLDMAPDPISKGDGGSNIPLFAIPKRKGRHGSALFQVPPSKQFGDPHRVERRALAKIVADAPEGQAVLDRAVVAHAADASLLVADALDRHPISTVLALVADHPARRLAHALLRLFSPEFTPPLTIHPPP